MLFNRHVEAAMVSHSGMIRSQNQDAAYADGEIPFYFVADGMGGLPEGNIASEMAIKTAANHVRERILLSQDKFKEEDLLDLLVAAFSEANRTLREYAEEKKITIGTTLSGLLLSNDRAYCCHVGDSPLFLLIKGKKLQQLTKDHNLGGDGCRHILTKAVGIKPTVERDVCSVPIHPGDTLLICTDGISTLLGKESIKNVLAMPHVSIDEMCLLLLGRVLAAGAPDNATLILVRTKPSGASLKRGVKNLALFIKNLLRSERRHNHG